MKFTTTMKNEFHIIRAGLAAILLGGAAASTAIAATQPREGLVVECRFEGNAIDSSGSQRHGTIHGRPWFAAGKSGQCIVLDGRQPVHAYRGATVQLEAVLANEDMLPPGEYPVRIQVVGPENLRVFEKTVTAKIPNPKGHPEPPLALPVFSETVSIDGPTGKYRLLATFDRGAAAAGGEIEFSVTDPADMPAVQNALVLWGDDPQLARWLAERGIRVKPFAQAADASREIILAGAKPPSGAGAAEFTELARRIASGSTAVFLCPAVFADGNQPTRWVPLATKGTIARFNECGGYYRGDAFAKRHAIFDGLPSGGILDYTFCREIIPQIAWCGLDPPAEVVSGAIRATLGYGSGLLVSVHDLGAGRFILNTLQIRETLGRDPVAERLLRNMLRYAARDAGKPLANLPGDFDRQLKAIGYAK